jgi:hypothetical protein
MMNFVLAYKAGIGWALSLIAATLTVIIFQVTFGFGPLVAIPVGVLAFVTMSVLWARFLYSVEGQAPPGSHRD